MSRPYARLAISPSVRFTSRTPGKVVAIHAALGQRVTKGTDLIEVQSVEIEKLETDLLHAENRLRLAQSDAERARARRCDGVGPGAVWAFECPARIDEARTAVQKAEAALDKAKAAAKAAARGSLAKAKEILSHAEAEQKGAGTDVKKDAEAVCEARTAQGFAEEARLIAERF